MALVTDGSLGTASLFTQVSSFAEGKPVEFLLREVEKIGDGGLRLNYQPGERKGNEVRLKMSEIFTVGFQCGIPDRQTVIAVLRKKGFLWKAVWI